ncbi:hypothetical protein niasHT_001457 [Heterodera trifolii]|uniref:SRR1-like domain-containing protein n=1 Tax=Heterodera trifolii TaxID=157864 RepID=A0ABD2M4H2_9BILA
MINNNNHCPPNVSVENDGGWTLAVRTKHGCRRRRVFSAKTTTKCGENLDRLSTNAFAEDGTEGGEVQAAVEELTLQMERLVCRMPHTFLNTILCFIKHILRNRPLALVRSFGIGPIETSHSSAYQLILLEAIKDRFGVPVVTSQDPVTTLCEKRYLEGRGITVLPPDNLKSEPLVDVGPTECTLLFMIHCTQRMYDSALSYYSRTHRLHNLILIGNDPNVALSCVFISQTSDSFPFPIFSAFAQKSVAFPLPDFEPSETAFMCTCISFLSVNNSE